MQFGSGSGRNAPPVQPIVNPYAAYSQYYQMPPVVTQGGYVYNSATGIAFTFYLSLFLYFL